MIKKIKTIKNKLLSLGGKYSTSENFKSFLVLSSMSYANSYYKGSSYEARHEEIYEAVANRYNKKELSVFSSMFADLHLLLSSNTYDVLGELYMKMNISSSEAGQFFTPFNISSFMAEAIADSIVEKMKKCKEWFSVSEPSCGSGGTIIALHNALEKRGY